MAQTGLLCPRASGDNRELASTHKSLPGPRLCARVGTQDGHRLLPGSQTPCEGSRGESNKDAHPTACPGLGARTRTHSTLVLG